MNQQQTLVSVILPTFNREKYVKKAIDSVSKQSSLLVSMVEELLGFTIAGGHSS